jgi:hypothetical protein
VCHVVDDLRIGNIRRFYPNSAERCQRNIMTNSSGLLNLVQADLEVIVRRSRVDYIGSLQGLLPIRAAESEEGINLKISKSLKWQSESSYFIKIRRKSQTL